MDYNIIPEFFRRANIMGIKLALLSLRNCKGTPFSKPSPYKTLVYKNKKQLPTHFRIEACTLCQLKCKECYMRKNEGKKDLPCGKGYLKFENYKKFCEKNVVESVALSNNGEIFLNPDLLKIMKYSWEHNIKLTDNNGVNFNDVKEEVLKGLVKYEFQQLVISLDGASQETYSQYRVGGNFDKVINNIKKVNYYKEKYNKNLPVIKWKFILFGHNEHEIPKAKQMAKELNCEILFVANWSPEYSPLRNIDFIKKELPDILLSVSEEQERSIMDDSFLPPCYQIWKEPQINWDGKLQGCCSNYQYDFGVNVFEVGLKKALNSPLYVDSKRLLQGLKPKHSEKLFCAKCRYYQMMKKANRYMLDME